MAHDHAAPCEGVKCPVATTDPHSSLRLGGSLISGIRHRYWPLHRIEVYRIRQVSEGSASRYTEAEGEGGVFFPWYYADPLRRR
jgi:hypothetical protein